MAKDRRRSKSAKIFRIRQGTTLRFDGVNGRFTLPLELPKGVKVRRVPIDETCPCKLK